MKLRIFAVAVLALIASFGSQAFGQKVAVASYPSGVEIYLDGVDTGTQTPTSFKTTDGAHAILYSAPAGWQSVTQNVKAARIVIRKNHPLFLLSKTFPKTTRSSVGPL